ncbi:MAG TPA: bifunctional GTP diphosphokinase/guanosine-3',5'-bis pyrophosphate 3'-pyrophosphohydrolase [Gammaproteobacteria bacterium]|nr:bifunctional GTP diphosphokinase/guanosine-3',5'-bis pyrophosphate 3'-pyrophosphohydrolase [Gammaproteobacteria bacterium]
MFLIKDLTALLETYLDPAQIAEIQRAYQFGARAHEGQQRLSGEPYIYHPLAVARILAEMHMDHQSILAALLHDVIEDTPTAKEQLVKEFGADVAELVDGVSKLTHIHFETHAEAQAENFRKMLLAMVRDIRVILVKLADRLHNMRTLGAMPLDKRRRIARETLEIYAPIASRLGMNTLRLELEDLGYASLYPMRYRILTEAVKKARGNRKEVVRKIENAIKRRLREEKLDGEVSGREKHLYSIYRKMLDKKLSFADVTDVYGFRIIVDTVDTCYRVLGAVHNLYKPVPGKFKDYIAIPKANGYQSLHTALFGPYGVPIEVQIRTRDMDRISEAGIAAHWLYKAGEASSSAQQRAHEWLRGLLEMQMNAGNSLEFLENVKIDLFPDEVYVFTPKGEIMQLPRGATVVDFAYAVHTDVGNTCVAAKIDRRPAPLSTTLANGQSVEVITSKTTRPNPAWLNFVATAKARATIRHFLKNLKRDESVELGRRLLDMELDIYELSLDKLTPARIKEVLKQYKLKTLDDLLEEIGLGNRMAQLVARSLSPEVELPGKADKKARRPSARPLVIKGTEGMVVTFAKCCWPIPGDPILGFVSAGRGIVIHTKSCKNVSEYRKHPEKWLDVQWAEKIEGEYPVEIRVEVANQRGVLATVAASIAKLGANIENVSIEEHDGMYTAITFTLAVHDRLHLARIMRRLRALPVVVRISRVKG